MTELISDLELTNPLNTWRFIMINGLATLAPPGVVAMPSWQLEIVTKELNTGGIDLAHKLLNIPPHVFCLSSLEIERFFYIKILPKNKFWIMANILLLSIILLCIVNAPLNFSWRNGIIKRSFFYWLIKTSIRLSLTIKVIIRK